MILDFEGLPDHAARAIIGAIDRETAAENGWTFVMLSPAQNRAVIDWLLEHAERRREASPCGRSCSSTSTATPA